MRKNNMQVFDSASTTEYVLNEPEVREDGIYTPLSSYTPKGTCSNYQKLIPKEIFIEAFDKWCRHKDLPNIE